jgi:Raf kinase inhibitor-like YbhB/YbcL family protein
VKRLSRITFSTVGLLALAYFASGQDWQNNHFSVQSSTFQNNTTLPISTIFNYQYNGTNICSIDGSPGGDESPELSWRNVPRGTRSFAVTVFDTTAGVVHWGMYDISATTTELPQNAGVTGSSYGKQVVNTYGTDGINAGLDYGGPCPPAGYPPNVHHYVFTVYALDKELDLPFSANFPPTALTLYRALADAGSSGHVLASASITGLYSTTPE